MSLTMEKQLLLRQCYDDGLNKNQTAIKTGCAEATVHRYFVQWNALASKTTFDLNHLSPKIIEELDIQARMRRMSLYQFVFRILVTVVEDDLSKAIVDIPEHHPVKKRLVSAKS